MRLRRSDLSRPGYTRRRSGRGFRYLDHQGRAVRDAGTLERIRALVIPPAWQDVWISPDECGHIQATGQDAAGRKQYIYHPVWRRTRDKAKFDHALKLAARLPAVRDRLCRDLTGGRGLTEARVLAAVVRLLDLGEFRIGTDEYARRDEDPSYGLSTLRPEHVRTRGGLVVLEFTGKSGVEHSTPVADAEVATVLKDLKRRRRGEERLFAYWDPSAKAWRRVTAELINTYLREVSGEDMTAKDFRTWQGTVKAARELAAAGPQRTQKGRQKVVAHAMKEVADLLGNTPAVARVSYVDPRVVDLYNDGTVAAGVGEQAVLKLLTDDDPARGRS
jgi:DNA topoisomerase IB